MKLQEEYEYLKLLNRSHYECSPAEQWLKFIISWWLLRGHMKWINLSPSSSELTTVHTRKCNKIAIFDWHRPRSRWMLEELAVVLCAIPVLRIKAELSFQGLTWSYPWALKKKIHTQFSLALKKKSVAFRGKIIQFILGSLCCHRTNDPYDQYISKGYALAQTGVLSLIQKLLGELFWPVLCRRSD